MAQFDLYHNGEYFGSVYMPEDWTVTRVALLFWAYEIYRVS